MAIQIAKLKFGTLKAIAESEKKSGALPLTAVAGKTYTIDAARIEQLANNDNPKAIRSLKGMSTNGRIYTKYKCTVDTSDKENCGKWQDPTDAAREPFYYPKFEAIETSDEIQLEELPESKTPVDAPAKKASSPKKTSVDGK